MELLSPEATTTATDTTASEDASSPDTTARQHRWQPQRRPGPAPPLPSHPSHDHLPLQQHAAGPPWQVEPALDARTSASLVLPGLAAGGDDGAAAGPAVRRRGPRQLTGEGGGRQEPGAAQGPAAEAAEELSDRSASPAGGRPPQHASGSPSLSLTALPHGPHLGPARPDHATTEPLHVTPALQVRGWDKAYLLSCSVRRFGTGAKVRSVSVVRRLAQVAGMGVSLALTMAWAQHASQQPEAHHRAPAHHRGRRRAGWRVLAAGALAAGAALAAAAVVALSRRRRRRRLRATSHPPAPPPAAARHALLLPWHD